MNMFGAGLDDGEAFCGLQIPVSNARASIENCIIVQLSGCAAVLLLLLPPGSAGSAANPPRGVGVSKEGAGRAAPLSHAARPLIRTSNAPEGAWCRGTCVQTCASGLLSCLVRLKLIESQHLQSKAGRREQSAVREPPLQRCQGVWWSDRASHQMPNRGRLEGLWRPVPHTRAQPHMVAPPRCPQSRAGSRQWGPPPQLPPLPHCGVRDKHTHRMSARIGLAVEPGLRWEAWRAKRGLQAQAAGPRAASCASTSSAWQGPGCTTTASLAAFQGQ